MLRWVRMSRTPVTAQLALSSMARPFSTASASRGRAGWRVDGEEFAPDAVHLVVILDVREDEVDLHNPVQSGARGCQHMFHVSQSLANLIGDRPEVASAGSGV